MAQIFALSSDRPADAAPACRASETDLTGIARRLKILDRPQRAIIAAIRLLIEHNGFPPPRSPRFVKGIRQTGAAAVWSRSKWDRDEVDLWFDGDLPPAAAARAAEAGREQVRHALAARALELVA